jgi:hypothetical protein
MAWDLGLHTLWATSCTHLPAAMRLPMNYQVTRPSHALAGGASPTSSVLPAHYSNGSAEAALRDVL